MHPHTAVARGLVLFPKFYVVIYLQIHILQMILVTTCSTLSTDTRAFLIFQSSIMYMSIRIGTETN